ncbi:MAG TPA: hypothetical protein VFQ65_15195 [Kofleriaceae bacterium]|nr:hypothetical protein [Kofleriaceae bacterium]
MASRLLSGYFMRHLVSSSALLLVLAACEGALPPPPPLLTVTSPQRSLIQTDGSQIVVQGTAVPGPSGDAVTSVTVNKVPATLSADGSFTATIAVPIGATLIETVATAGGVPATDARAVQIGQLRPVGTSIDRAVTAALSAQAFARLSAAAGPLIKNMDLTTLLAPMQPMANLGDDIANVKISITKLTLGDAKITLTPVGGGLAFSAELDTLNVTAKADYAGALVPDGTTTIGVTADQVTISGTLNVTPAGTAGFTTKLVSPMVHTTNMKLTASGLVGAILDLLNNNLASTIQSMTTQMAESAMEPMLNDALGALAGPQQIDVLGKKLDLQASPAAIAFSRDGAIVTMNLQAKLEGSETSPGFVFTPNGAPAMTMTNGIQLALADDLVNEMLAEVHALGVLDLSLQQDFGVFDNAEIKLTMPPMISANNSDGSMRLVLGDMMASFTDHGNPVITAAINAQVDLAILRGTNAQEIALQFGKADLVVNVLSDTTGMLGGDDLEGPAGSGIAVQLDSIKQFLVTVPVPSIAGVTLDNLSLHADSGYVLVAGDVH